MNICVGLLAPSPAWEQLLLQEGIPFRAADSPEDLPVGRFSVLVVNRRVEGVDRAAVERYLREGGAVIGSAQALDGVAGMTSRQERIEFIVPEGDELLKGISLFDLGVGGDLPREANTLRTQTGSFAVFAGDLGDGVGVVLPFEPESVLLDLRAAEKNFYAHRDRLPSERVSLPSKGELRHLLHAALEFLHHRRGIPYVHLWYFPDDQRTVFAFRVDSDGASRTDVEALYMNAREFDIGMSWFLDVKSHESWLEHFAAMSGQEIGVHCYEHRTFDGYDENVRNIGRARRTLEGLGIRPAGFAAPYGIWNIALAKAVDTIGFVYSSEFSLAYDTLPFFPPSRTGTHAAFQIPIHPICPGSLSRIGYDEENASAYFAARVEEKLARREPLFFYHHPGHRAWSVVRSLFASVRERKIECMTMGEYGRWWVGRTQFRFAARVEGGNLMIETEGDPGIPDALRVMLRVSTRAGKEAIVRVTPSIDLGKTALSDVPLYLPPADIRRTREFDPRALLGDLYTKMTRRFR